MQKLTMLATIELALDDVIDVQSVEMSTVGMQNRKIKIGVQVKLQDVVLRFPLIEKGEIGSLVKSTHEGGRTIVIKSLLLRSLQGEMLPVFDGDRGEMVFFTTDKDGVADPIVISAIVSGEKEHTKE